MVSASYTSGNTKTKKLPEINSRRVVQIPEGLESIVLGNPVLTGYLVEHDTLLETTPELLVKCLDLIVQVQGAAESWAGFVMRNEFSEHDVQKKIRDVIHDNEFPSEALFTTLNQYALGACPRTRFFPNSSLFSKK